MKTDGQNYGFTVSSSNKQINLSIFHEECGSLWKKTLTIQDLLNKYKMLPIFTEIEEVFSYLLDCFKKASDENFGLLRIMNKKDKIELCFKIIINESTSKVLFRLALEVELPGVEELPKLV